MSSPTDTKFPTIPQPNASDPKSVQACLIAIKETLEILTGQRGTGVNRAKLMSDG